MTPIASRNALTMREVAAELGVHTATVRRMMTDGTIKFLHTGKSQSGPGQKGYRFPKEEVARVKRILSP